MNTHRRKIISYILLVICITLYVGLTYFLDRTHFIPLISIYFSLFFLTWKIIELQKENSSFLFGIGLVFRLILLGTIPNLSQDFYRFIWDGNLVLAGLNPYLSTPEEFIATGKSIPLEHTLFQGMGSLSAGNYSNYPPLNQVFFSIAAWFGNAKLINTVIALRLIIIMADIGIYWVGRRLLRTMNLNGNRVFWYFLNPFIILELTGNLHFEGVMLFFLICGLYFLYKGKWISSAVFVGFSIAVKLLPLIFLPLLLRYLKAKKAFLYYTLSAVVLLVLFLPFISTDLPKNYFLTIGLWFQKFEFNASLYYIIRWIGFQLAGYNVIQLAGPLLGFMTFLFISILSLQAWNRLFRPLLISMLLAVTAYLFLATTVHPWYLATPLLLSIFSRFTYVYIWSFLVVLSYFTYSTIGYEENMWLLFLEYGIVFVVMGYELYYKKPAFAPDFSFSKNPILNNKE